MTQIAGQQSIKFDKSAHIISGHLSSGKKRVRVLLGNYLTWSEKKHLLVKIPGKKQRVRCKEKHVSWHLEKQNCCQPRCGMFFAETFWDS